MTLPVGAAGALSKEWSVGTLEGSGAAAPSGKGFGAMLANQVGALTKAQQDAAGAAQQLAAGTASDPSAAVMAVEKARLSMQLAAQIRTKAVEAVNEIFHTQV